MSGVQTDAPLPDGGYRAVLQYEKLSAMSEVRATKEAALLDLVEGLHNRGYRQLRSRLSFREGAYFGSLETWIEYPDPEQPAVPRQGRLQQRLRGLWQRLFHV